MKAPVQITIANTGETLEISDNTGIEAGHFVRISKTVVMGISQEDAGKPTQDKAHIYFYQKCDDGVYRYGLDMDISPAEKKHEKSIIKSTNKPLRIDFFGGLHGDKENTQFSQALFYDFDEDGGVFFDPDNIKYYFSAE